jgi:hypothetical protein
VGHNKLVVVFNASAPESGAFFVFKKDYFRIRPRGKRNEEG